MNRADTFAVDPRLRVLLADLGVSAANVLRRAELPEDMLARGPVRLPPADYFRLWLAIEAEVDDPAFPIRIIEALRVESFMPALFAAVCSPNFMIAAQRLSQYKRLIAPVAIKTERTEQQFSVTFHWLDTLTKPPRSLLGMELAFVVNLARLGTRQRIVPEQVISQVPLTHPSFVEYFGVQPILADHATIRMSIADAERPFLTANEAIWSAFEPDLRRRLSALDASADTKTRVRAALLEALPSGAHAMPQVAKQLGMSKRTLQRRLAGEGTTFQQVLQKTREDLARHYLTETELVTAEIGFLLGFDEPNSFYRAFRDWTGLTPEGLRRLVAQPTG